MIDPALSDRLKAELRRRAERRREALARLHDAFPDTLGPLPEEKPVGLDDLSAEQLAQLVTDTLWPPSAEECRERALRHLDDVFSK